MKFELNESNNYELGLVVRHYANIIGVFWDENPVAASYIIELYRLNFQFPSEGFLSKVEITESTWRSTKPYERNIMITNTEISVSSPAYIGKNFVKNDEKLSDKKSQRQQYSVILYPFTSVKPVYYLTIERNRYYTALNDLVAGDYIIVLKSEDKQGNIIEQSIPYYFCVSESSVIPVKVINRW